MPLPPTSGALSDQLAAAAEAAVRGRTGADDGTAVHNYLAAYYRHVMAEDILGREPEDVAGAALSHRALAADRAPGTSVVRVLNPRVEEHGWTSPHTVVEIVTDDMPFLVDSVSGCLTRYGSSIHLLIHPQLPVRRSLTGELLEVPAADEGHDVYRESWMHVEVDRESDPQHLADLTAQLQATLRDVSETVEDWRKMRAAAGRIADELVTDPPAGVAETEVSEAWELLNWLVDEHFTFIGYREYELVGSGDDTDLVVVPGTGLGVLRSDAHSSSAFRRLRPEARAKAHERQLLVLTKANRRSTVHRPAYLDYVGIKRFDETGRVVGERRFLGLYTSSAYTESVMRIPVLRRKSREILQAAGYPENGHSYRELQQVIETYPRDEMLQAPVEDLLPVMLQVQHRQERRQTRLFLRPDAYGRFVSAMVYLPRDRYTTSVRLAIGDLLMSAFGGTELDFTARVSESVSARLHFVVRVDPSAGLPQVDLADLERRLVEVTRTWADHLADALVEEFGEERAHDLSPQYAAAFPEAYKEDFPARVGALDLGHLEELPTGGMSLNLYEPIGAAPGERRFKIYRSDDPLSLTDVLPVLQRMGVHVVDERPYEVERSDGRRLFVYDFGLLVGTTAVLDGGAKRRFEEAFAAVWSGQADSDGFNALVLRAGLTWREAMVLRAYARYARQGQVQFSPEYIEEAIVGNPELAASLVALFRARFDPGAEADRQAGRAERLVAEIEAGLDQVSSLDADRILRGALRAITATLRTNYFVADADGRPRPFLSVKLDPQQLPGLPEPRPVFEIWVHSPRVEGVHLRFGSVARGGLRWSDRKEDFRTEVLGLVKAQEVKNAVIVPVGAKGGFVPRQLPDPTVDRDAWRAEGEAAYRLFISGLLDLTDNLVGGAVVPPTGVVRYDGDDPYLVVAADKGTATFSDIANEVAVSYGFWLGDAFASGGSVGYDHKAMGITARGAWESVKRHFREMGVDTQTQEFTVVGIGDMSGDVFGNGMLLSEHIQLMAAFDHRHIFIDPTPDAAVSFAERRRLFHLPRSSWGDYDPSLLSAGGAIHPRSAKSVELSSQARAALGIEATGPFTPDEVIAAILRAPVDLLFNGGIGTYVKAQTESHLDVGDKANDAVRVDGADLRCLVVGEGGNLGLTQAGRIEAARAGIRINTDAIDNSAGVDTSDHEVNLKILLDRVVADGDLTVKQRNELLAAMTDEVAQLVLRDNYEQNVLLGNARSQAISLLPVHQRLIRELEVAGGLDRVIEVLPADEELARRAAAGEGLSSPELSVLVAYVKNTLARRFLDTALPDDPWFARLLDDYFPTEVRQRFGARLAGHPLHRQIVVTSLVNDLVNRGGISYAFRAAEEIGASYESVARAYTVVREVFELPRFWAEVESLDNQVPTAAQTALLLESRRLLDRAARWLLQHRHDLSDVTGAIERYRPTVQALLPAVGDLLRGDERDRLERRADEFVGRGAPEELAVRAAALLDAFSLLDVTDIATAVGDEPADIAALYFVLSEHFAVDAMLLRITDLPRDDRWQAMARMALRYDLYATQAALTRQVALSTDPALPADDRVAAWEQANAEAVSRLRTTMREITSGDGEGLAPLSVGLRVLRSLVDAVA